MQRGLIFLSMLLLLSTGSWGFEVDTSAQPPLHPPQQPADGATVAVNPPAMTWRQDDRAATYTVEFCRSGHFDADVIRVEGIDMPFYNHSTEFEQGPWHWRYFVVTGAGEVSQPGPVRTFIVSPQAVSLPVPPTERIGATMPAHPRIFVTPDTLEQFRARRDGPARDAWAHIEHTANRWLQEVPPDMQLQPMPADPGTSRRQVFYLKGGQIYSPAGQTVASMNAAATRAGDLAIAYLISQDERYGQAARRWLVHLAPFRIDWHLEDRGQHDTAVYAYEFGLRSMAVAYDHIYDLLTEDEQRQVLDHVEYHGENAMAWIRDRVKIHLNYQSSHAQQCMHPLLTTTLAVATESDKAAEWADYLLRQYVNRIAWGGDDGGYSEGQTYGHKFRWILEALAALKTATGLDVFSKPRLRNSGDFWLYCMSLNYWWNHWGDTYQLLQPMVGNTLDGYIANLLAANTGNRQLRWWAETVVCDLNQIPFRYLSDIGLTPRPPIDIPQARRFPDVGQLAAYDRFWDHSSNRIFFRSSPYGSHSHAHADQNGFVLHAGGEIMACDAGYYTYYGDEYHYGFSKATVAHNSILVNGQGQPHRSIQARGNISEFLNTADYCVFMGEAAEAYPEMLEQFDRMILFIRPDIWVVYDELKATDPSEFSWVMNAFAQAEFAPDRQEMTIVQRHQRLRISHLAPDGMTYTQSNERPFPMQTRAWCRYTDAFPQQHTIRVTTPPAGQERILAFMRAYQVGTEDAVGQVRLLEAREALGLQFDDGPLTETCIIQRRFEGRPAEVASEGVQLRGRAASVGRTHTGDTARWVLLSGEALTADGRTLLSATAPCDAAGNFNSPNFAAQIWIQHPAAMDIELFVAQPPQIIMAAPFNRPAEARPVAFEWLGDRLRVRLAEAGQTVLWVDPSTDITRPPSPLQLTITDAAGAYAVEMETSVAENGDIVAFADLMLREPGDYTLAAEGADLLVQDRWDPDLSVRDVSSVTGPVRDGTEVYIRYPAGAASASSLSLLRSYSGNLVNLLRNGGFEAGIADYPPRGWTTSHPRQMGYTWPHWTQDDAFEGISALKFHRPEVQMTLRSQPMLLRTAGTYVLRFMARGDATHAKVVVSGQRGRSAEVQIAPSEQWAEYRTEVELEPGYATVSIPFAAGGAPDQTLWVDDMQFGYVAQ